MDIVRTQRYSLKNTFPAEMEKTVEVYRLAVEALSRVAFTEWGFLSLLETQNDRRHGLEKLVHSTGPRKVRGENRITAGNKARYACFDWLFDNLPAYYMRSAIDDALGVLASHVTRYRKWKKERDRVILSAESPSILKRKLKKFARPPTFQPITRKCPVLFRGNGKKVRKAVGKNRLLKERIAGVQSDPGGTILWLESDLAAIKLFDGKSWNWRCVRLKKPKKERFKTEDGWTEMSPTLVQTGGTHEIHVPMETKVVLKEEGVTDKTGFVLAVDLGLNTRATASIVGSDGAIHGRFFIDLPQETGCLDHLLGEIAQRYRASGQPQDGRKTCVAEWDKVGRYSDEIAQNVSAQLVKIARDNGCQVIVFEHLGKLQIPRDFYGARRLRKKLHFWLQGKIQKLTKEKGHVHGIRFSRVLARETSVNAFDGSGGVKRNGSKKIARFQNDIQYDADLNASYNIGARYWIREWFKKYPKTAKDLGVDAHPQAGGSPTSKAAVRKTEVAGQGKACPASDTPDRLTAAGVPVARHRQVLASLISLVNWVGGQAATTVRGRIHATTERLPGQKKSAVKGSPVQNAAGV
ncbi:MAG TPA: transposase [Geobacteraceae bacterium]|nr:transposase [Geobacteraceae bacterium]